MNSFLVILKFFNLKNKLLYYKINKNYKNYKNYNNYNKL